MCGVASPTGHGPFLCRAGADGLEACGAAATPSENSPLRRIRGIIQKPLGNAKMDIQAYLWEMNEASFLVAGELKF